jgi:hypothetical protein
MRLLIAVKSCRLDRERSYHNVIRETWGKDIISPDVDLRFFLGNPSTELLVSRSIVRRLMIQLGLSNDEILVNCDDGYSALPYKTREILSWSAAVGYDFTFLADTDTFVIPEKLLKCGFEQYDYYGLIQRALGKTFQYDAVSRSGKHYPGEYYPWASGGFGYFLSRKAADIIAHCEPDFWAEDTWVGQIMNEQYNRGRATIGDANNLAKQCSWHFPAHEYNSGYDLKFGWMEKMHKEHQ